LRAYTYLRTLGAEGLRDMSGDAVLNANYVQERLRAAYSLPYDRRVLHEVVFSGSRQRARGVRTLDIAKRLIDFGFHAPTMSFPVAGTLMVEPTESEDLGELDRFCEAMIAIRGEIDRVEAGEWSPEDSPLRGAPHTAASVLTGSGERAYSAEAALFPTGPDPDKYWPPVGRIDQAYGDRNLLCACPPPEAFA